MSLSTVASRGDFPNGSSYSTSDSRSSDFYVQFFNEGSSGQGVFFYGDSTATGDNEAFPLFPGEKSEPFYVVGTDNGGSGSYAYRASAPSSVSVRYLVTTLD